ncbi:3-hydroxyacyl-CoA dehydrogenase family protein [Methylobacterium isbiliense]|jgi:3-hydroxybutyryl-CoA dehydrogenase|uniref:L-gulonate 3-dehydrogenase n=1 Tax=Methylobacterium isbiliense TaxID=315478 RepID=A0ABQ4S873_9HYPH|nr:3-hydroxyacyl-CoA dehydrogenase family protein [Methylobacterium isbiliense]MDN3625520.1 3-hydroxyacyl-CoA dehydrogenase family protein [Methylobacterium isbiliense]GJD98674.1 putative 3-hydroxybutyryl-CoA dehydrogenase [Methylobacterium isbiliense]
MTEIAVIGAGLMGHGIALVLALGGHRVRLTDSRAETLAQVQGLMASALDTLREAGAVGADWTAERLAGAVRLSPDLAETVAGARLVIEAITENPEAKRALFGELDRLCPPETILASNTSYLDVFPLIPAARQSRAIVAHWYTPPYIVDLVDVVPGPQTDPAVVEEVRALVVGLGQVPIVLKRFIPGYVANRIQSAISAEVYHLLDEGIATPREIDDAIVHGLSLRIPILGHLAKADFTGIELLRHALANASYSPPPARTRSEALDALVEEGRTGVMAGRGFFDWGGRDPADLFRDRDRRLLALKQAMKAVGRMEGR